MNIKAYIKKVDCKDPIFADFFLDKYRSLATTNLEEAEKIEKYLFTGSFLLNIINGNDHLLKSKTLKVVPYHLIANIMDEITDLLEHGRLDDINLYLTAPLIHAHRPDKISSILQKQIEQEKKWDPIIGNFY